MTLYKFLRNTHLLIGLFSFLFVMMYGVSSVQMSHNAWFNLKPAVTESQVTLATGITDPRDIARQLMDRGAVRGELTQIRDSTFRVIRPGAVHEVNYSPQTGVATIRTRGRRRRNQPAQGQCFNVIAEPVLSDELRRLARLGGLEQFVLPFQQRR